MVGITRANIIQLTYHTLYFLLTRESTYLNNRDTYKCTMYTSRSSAIFLPSAPSTFNRVETNVASKLYTNATMYIYIYAGHNIQHYTYMCTSERIDRSVDNVWTKYESVHYTASTKLYRYCYTYTLEHRFSYNICSGKRWNIYCLTSLVCFLCIICSFRFSYYNIIII